MADVDDVEVKEPKTKSKSKAPSGVWVKAVKGDMLNLFTNVWYTQDPKKVELDEFVQGQVDAGKLEIVEP